MGRIKCNLINYCDYRFGFCRCFEGYEDYCIDLCPKHNNSLLPASERKRIKKQNKKWRKIREKERNILRLNRMNRLIERLKNKEFSAILTKSRDRIMIALSKFYIKKYEKKYLLLLKSPTLGCCIFTFILTTVIMKN